MLSTAAWAGCAKTSDNASRTPSGETPAAADSIPRPDTGTTAGPMMGTMNSSPGATSAAWDLQFIDTMIAHHESAVTMAGMAREKAGHGELRTMAEQMSASQTAEIERMRAWRNEWYPNAPAAINMDLPGMMESMQGMNTQHMSTMSGSEFDLMFIDMMIPHHRGAITMAREALNRAEHGELKTLAQEIIDGQQAEIDQMNEWKGQWRSTG
jgi:uncharacterized protein (DUF305 family)